MTRPSVPPRPWIPGCPLVPVHYGPTVSTTCTSYSLTSGVSHTPREGDSPGPTQPFRSPPQPLYHRTTSSPNTSGPAARQTEEQPRSPRSAGITGAGRSQAVRPALPCPCRTDPQARPPPTCLPALVPRWAWKHTVYAVGASSVTFARPGARAPGPSTEAPCWPATLQSRCRASPSAHCLARMRIWL